jgi:hypothetical protein
VKEKESIGKSVDSHRLEQWGGRGKKTKTDNRDTVQCAVATTITTTKSTSEHEAGSKLTHSMSCGAAKIR